MYVTAPVHWTLVFTNASSPTERPATRRIRFSTIQAAARYLYNLGWPPITTTVSVIDPKGDAGDIEQLVDPIIALHRKAERHRQHRKRWLGCRHPHTLAELRANAAFETDDYDGCERKQIKARLRKPPGMTSAAAEAGTERASAERAGATPHVYQVRRRSLHHPQGHQMSLCGCATTSVASRNCRPLLRLAFHRQLRNISHTSNFDFAGGLSSPDNRAANWSVIPVAHLRNGDGTLVRQSRRIARADGRFIRHGIR